EVSLLWLEEGMDAWEDTIHNSRHTLYPVCDNSPDNIVGILNAKDYFRLEDKSRDAVMKGAVKPAYFVPGSVKADVLFRNMKRSRNNLAVVLDEYGGMSGIVTMNDLLEELVGDFECEEIPGTKVPEIEKTDPNTWKISGNISLEEVKKALGVDLPCDDHETFTGFVFDALGSVPDDGTTLSTEISGLSVDVTEIKDHIIRSAVVRYAASDNSAELLSAESNS
ncbi:MAG: transporter associated domain-containing protein, partial [Eubacteriales bacterium]